MSKLNALKKRLALLAMGASAFALGQGCNNNDTLISFFSGVADGTLDVVEQDLAQAVGPRAASIIVAPAAGLTSDLFTNWLSSNFPEDPTFGSPYVQ